MKISNKEKTMLCVLGSIMIGFGYYQFVYLFQTNELQEKIKAGSVIEQKYTTAMNTINSMEDKKSDVKILRAKINDQSVSFYPTISEEKIIIELDTLMKDSGLKGGITFAPIVSDSVEISKKEGKALAESSLQGIVDEYNNTSEDTEKTQQSNDTTANNSTKSETNTKDSNNTRGTSNANSTKDKKKNTVQYLKCEVKFEGNYDAIDKFLNTIGKNEKKIVVNSIKISSDTLDAVKGTISLEIYSVPKINDELESYLKWDLNNTYGKNIPFSKGAASGVTESNKDSSDFIASVRSTTSDLPTIMMGKTDDSLRTTYVYADSNSVENVEMTLIQDGNKYYYKYKTLKGSFPVNYEGAGAEFVPTSKNIVLNILSENRVTANDNSEIKLKIVNKTDKLAEINITGDDTANPRVVVDGDGNNISVNKK